MSQPEHALTLPARMVRVALVAPRAHLRDALVTVADAGTVELSGELPAPAGEAVDALRRLERAGADGVEPALAAESPDLAELERAGPPACCAARSSSSAARRRPSLTAASPRSSAGSPSTSCQACRSAWPASAARPSSCPADPGSSRRR